MGYEQIKFPEGTKFTVTGGAGFIGSNLCEAILKKGCKVCCLDDFSRGRRENIKEFLPHPDFQLVEGDIRNFVKIQISCFIRRHGEVSPQVSKNPWFMRK